MNADFVEATLRKVCEHLAQGDAPSAAEALSALETALPSAAPLSRAELARLKQVYAECSTAVDAANARIGASLRQSAGSRRAIHAYEAPGREA